MSFGVVGGDEPGLDLRSVLAIDYVDISALVVAASLNRALYVSYDAMTESCEVMVQVKMDDEGRQALRSPGTVEGAIAIGTTTWIVRPA